MWCPEAGSQREGKGRADGGVGSITVRHLDKNGPGRIWPMSLFGTLVSTEGLQIPGKSWMVNCQLWSISALSSAAPNHPHLVHVPRGAGTQTLSARWAPRTRWLTHQSSVLGHWFPLLIAEVQTQKWVVPLRTSCTKTRVSVCVHSPQCSSHGLASDQTSNVICSRQFFKVLCTSG